MNNFVYVFLMRNLIKEHSHHLQHKLICNNIIKIIYLLKINIYLVKVSFAFKHRIAPLLIAPNLFNN